MNRIGEPLRHGMDADQVAKARKAGAQFEAVLLNNVLGGVERTFTDLPGGHKDQCTEVYSGLAMQTLSSALAQRGGVGLGSLIADALVERAGHSHQDGSSE